MKGPNLMVSRPILVFLKLPIFLLKHLYQEKVGKHRNYRGLPCRNQTGSPNPASNVGDILSMTSTIRKSEASKINSLLSNLQASLQPTILLQLVPVVMITLLSNKSLLVY